MPSHRTAMPTGKKAASSKTSGPQGKQTQDQYSDDPCVQPRVQPPTLGKAIFDSVPDLMDVLTALAQVHPFVAVALAPFRFAYNQEVKRRDTEHIRLSLFESVKDVMLVAVEMKDLAITPDNQCLPSDGEAICNRLTRLGEQMKVDIEGCYNALDAFDKELAFLRFFKASSWNNELSKWKAIFKTRREDLQFALTLTTATTVQHMNTMMSEMRRSAFVEFQSYVVPQDRQIIAFLEENGGQELVLADDNKCAALIKLQEEQTVRHNISLLPKRGRHDGSDDIVALRKSYFADVTTVIKENADSFSRRLSLGLADKTISQIWKEEGWRGSTKTRQIILAIRNHFIELERTRHAGALYTTWQYPYSNEMPDAWALEYFQLKRLLNLEHVLDPEAFGMTTIVDINQFTSNKPQGWSLPRWVAYFTIGWQIQATRYCREIQKMYSQMHQIHQQTSLQMPGNKGHISDYILETWPIVLGLISSPEQFECSHWLASHFQDYQESKEHNICTQLEKVYYVIDSTQMVHDILAGEAIEQGVLALLTILVRWHLSKMHHYMTTEIQTQELFQDAFSIKLVLEVAWLRFNELHDTPGAETYKQQQISDLDHFQNYFLWNEWSNEEKCHTTNLLSLGSADRKLNMPISLPMNHKIQTQQPMLMVLSQVQDEALRQHQAAQKPQLMRNAAPLNSSVSSGDYVEELLSIVLEATLDEHQANVIKIHGEGSSFTQAPVTIGKISGTITAPLHHSVLPVSFDITFKNDRYAIQGLFDSTTNLITGKLTGLHGLDTGSNASLYAKKSSTDTALCHRPLVQEKLSPKQLWHFAYDAISGQLLRSHPTRSYVLHRFQKIRRYLGLMHYCGGHEDAIERAELQQGFNLIEYNEIIKLHIWYKCAVSKQLQLMKVLPHVVFTVSILSPYPAGVVWSAKQHPWKYISQYRKEVEYKLVISTGKSVLASFNHMTHNMLHSLVRLAQEDVDMDEAEVLSQTSQSAVLYPPRIQAPPEQAGQIDLQNQIHQIEDRLSRMENMLQALLNGMSTGSG
ncbi:hypothetical protein C8F01DRAFT_1233056 [Mycena amicta]|nr:hypothetical protein C8F01DRAFT_1233055 [Mycena amicta]KAJ7057631.1 hypothetical protein C8F01DRAFT_1233056 [Mycena amicta]